MVVLMLRVCWVMVLFFWFIFCLEVCVVMVLEMMYDFD